MKRKEPERYDHRTMNRIRDRVAGLDDYAIVEREYNRATKREELLAEWVTTSGNINERQALRSHLAECIKLVDFELEVLHNAMSRRRIPWWANVVKDKGRGNK